MADEIKQENTNVVAPEAVAPVEAGASAPRREHGRGGRQMKNTRGRSRSVRQRVKPEFDHKVVNIRRVARVVAGGRRFSFSVALVAGNRKGRVGVGTGKAADTAAAIDKALRSAKKNMITVALTKTGSIPHEVKAKYSSGLVMIYPAAGRGLVAGGAVRVVLDLAGVKDVGAKILSGSKNHLNNAQAAVKALSQLMNRRRRA